MDKEKLSKILDSIYKATISESLKWKLASSIFNSDTERKYESVSLDGITKFSCNIKLDNNLKHNSITPFYIENKNMVDGGIHLHTNDYPLIKPLQEWIFKKHVEPNLKVPNQDLVMDDILKGIDVSEYRDKKIDDILKNSSDKKADNNKQGFFNKIFSK